MERLIRGIPVHYEEAGEGRPVVILHGLPGDHRLARHHLEPVFAAQPGWRRIYLDLPGMGRTPAGPSLTSVDDMLEVVLEFADEVSEGGRYSVVGISFGGYLARGVLARHAARIDGIMLWAPMVNAREAEGRLPEHRILERDPAVAAEVADDERRWLDMAVVQTAETLAAFRAWVKPGFLLADMAALGRMLEREELSDRNLAVQGPFGGPALVLTGRQDGACGYLDAWDLAADMTRATFAVLDRAGHAVATERAPLFRALVADWLDRLGREPAA